MAILSSGTAAAPGDTNPNHQAFQSGIDTGTTSGFPADWFAANGNTLPNAPGCPGAGQGGGQAFNPVMLTLRLRVPTNAKSFSFNSFFFSAEFPEFVCTTFNDFFVALVDAPVTTNPKDKNLAVYIAPDYKRYPIGVNLSHSTNLFAVCDDGVTGCSGGVPGTAKCLMGPALLGGTGFDTNTGGCGAPRTTASCSAAAPAGSPPPATWRPVRPWSCASRSGTPVTASSTRWCCSTTGSGT